MRAITLLLLVVAVTSLPDDMHVGVVHFRQNWLSQEGIDGMRKIGSTWKTLLSNGGTPVEVYVDEPERVIMVAHSRGDLRDIERFVMGYKPVVERYVISRSGTYST